MVYAYTVKKNGVLYKAGQEVPETKETSVQEEKSVKRGRPPKTEE